MPHLLPAVPLLSQSRNQEERGERHPSGVTLPISCLSVQCTRRKGADASNLTFLPVLALLTQIV